MISTNKQYAQFKRQLFLVFGNTKLKKQEAELKLSTRAQDRNETVTDFVEGVSRLYNLGDVKMLEGDMVDDLTKCVAEDVFHFISVKKFDTVDDCMDLRRHFEAFLCNRVAIMKFEMHPNVNSAADIAGYSEILIIQFFETLRTNFDK